MHLKFANRPPEIMFMNGLQGTKQAIHYSKADNIIMSGLGKPPSAYQRNKNIISVQNKTNNRNFKVVTQNKSI